MSIHKAKPQSRKRQGQKRRENSRDAECTTEQMAGTTVEVEEQDEQQTHVDTGANNQGATDNHREDELCGGGAYSQRFTEAIQAVWCLSEHGSGEVRTCRLSCDTLTLKAIVAQLRLPKVQNLLFGFADSEDHYHGYIYLLG